MKRDVVGVAQLIHGDDINTGMEMPNTVARTSVKQLGSSIGMIVKTFIAASRFQTGDAVYIYLLEHHHHLS